MRVQILSTDVVKPSNPTPVHLKTYNLSFIDQLSSQIPFGILFFFHTAGDFGSGEFDRLKQSLSETLTRFYPLAGRFIRNDVVVDCSDQGVQVSRARINGQLSEILGGSPETPLLDTFVPDPAAIVRSAGWPVLTVQINAFVGGGLALGIRILHNVLDGISLFAFVEDWAGATNRKVPNELVRRPGFELGSVFPARELVGLKLTTQLSPAMKGLVTKSFLFDGAAIAALRAEATAPESTGRRPSKVLAFTAYIWRTLISISCKKHGRTRPSLLSFAMSLRGRLALPIPENSFGTLVGHATARFTSERREVELHEPVALLRTAIKKSGGDFARAKNADEIYHMMIEYYNEIGGDRPSEVDLCRITSFCGFNCYGIDFGWGKPSWIATVSKFVELFLLIDDKSGDGIEAWVTLKEEDMVEFEGLYLSQFKSSNPRNCSKL